MDKDKALKLVTWLKASSMDKYEAILNGMTGSRTDEAVAEYFVELHNKHSWAFDSILSRAGLDGNNSSTEEK